MHRRNMLITGSTDGIGKETAKRLAAEGHNIWLHGRNQAKVEQCICEIFNVTGNNHLEPLVADFTSLREVKRMSLDLVKQTEYLDVLINNAGMMTDFKEFSSDGFEKTFQINYLSPFLLTNELLPLLRESTQGRIVHVSSMIHASAFDADNFTLSGSFNGSAAYAATKLYNILFSNKLARMLQRSHITSNSLHPGVINTKLLRQHYGNIGEDIKEGANTPVYLATDESVASHSGKYFVNKHLANPAKIATDKQIQDLLWNKTLPLVSNYLNQ